jgi:hypothetical protein
LQRFLKLRRYVRRRAEDLTRSRRATCRDVKVGGEQHIKQGNHTEAMAALLGRIWRCAGRATFDIFFPSLKSFTAFGRPILIWSSSEISTTYNRNVSCSTHND